MAYDLHLSPAAENDLAEIWAYIAIDSSTAADQFVDVLYAKCLALTHTPRMGRRRDELVEGIRSFPFQSYVIYYRLTGTTVEVVRVLHGSRDVGPGYF